jgi:HlyD family secretion protein
LNIQFLSKSAPRRVLVWALAATALTAGIGYYGMSQFSQGSQPTEAKQPTTVAEPRVVALGKLEPQTEVTKISVPAALNNDRVAQLLVKRGGTSNYMQQVRFPNRSMRLDS